MSHTQIQIERERVCVCDVVCVCDIGRGYHTHTHHIRTHKPTDRQTYWNLHEYIYIYYIGAGSAQPSPVYSVSDGGRDGVEMQRQTVSAIRVTDCFSVCVANGLPLRD